MFVLDCGQCGGACPSLSQDILLIGIDNGPAKNTQLSSYDGLDGRSELVRNLRSCVGVTELKENPNDALF